MAPSGRASNAALRFRRFAAWKSGEALRASSRALAAFGPLARKAMSLSALTAAGQASFVIALPLLSRLYTPSDFGLFTIYLSIVNIGGPLVGLKFKSALYTVRTKEEAGVSLVLSLVTIIVMTSVAAVALIVFAGPFGGPPNSLGPMGGLDYCRPVCCWLVCGPPHLRGRSDRRRSTRSGWLASYSLRR